MSDFQDLTGSEFERADLSGSRFSKVRLNSVTFQHADALRHQAMGLVVVLNEEWYHRQFAERDLAALEQGA